MKKKQLSPKLPIEEFLARRADSMAEAGEDLESTGKIETIIMLFEAGYTRSEIVKAGFNRSTVYRQIGDFVKLKTGHVKEFAGIPMYESRIEIMMRKMKCNREEAIEHLSELDHPNPGV